MYADVILPVPLNVTFTYRVPPHLAARVAIGSRVIVPFGLRKMLTGIITALRDTATTAGGAPLPAGLNVKDVIEVPDAAPVVIRPQLRLWQWMAEYYLAPLGDVYKAAVPAGLKIGSETSVSVTQDMERSDWPELTERQISVVAALDHAGKPLTPMEIAKATNRTSEMAVIYQLMDLGVLRVNENLVERYRPKRYTCVLFADEYRDNPQAALEQVKSAPKQEKLLMALLTLSREAGREGEVTRAQLLERAEVSPSILTALVTKGIVRLCQREMSRWRYDGPAKGTLPTLTPAQSEALSSIHGNFDTHGVTLLHGVTSSGKTEIYCHLIDFVLRHGRQALMLVPEIALTTQLTQRLQKVFGDKVIVYHSRFSDNERVDIWRRMLTLNEPFVVLGARSSVFLPFSALGLVIVDEEHDTSYKQSEPSPRYNGRDAAIVLGAQHGAKVLLGSATPSIETYYKALSGKFGLVSLSQRYDDAQLPTVEIVDLKKARLAGQLSGAFATHTVEEARKVLDQKGQVIFFHNRRGYAPMARCKQCAFVPKCDQCDVSLTYHHNQRALVCHYCGSVYPLPAECPVCHQPSLEIVGYGTERIEDDVAQRFPDSRILRMDLDTTRAKDAYQRIIDTFSAHEADILVGTQMVTKGLDFGAVNMVGVLGADALIHFPDFRSPERAFNMLEQVSGRAGRRHTPGRVLIQTYDPQHPLLQHVVAHDYQGYYKEQIEERRKYFYPPFTRLIYVYLKHRDNAFLTSATDIYAQRLKELFGNRVSDPDTPSVSRVQNLNIRKIMLKVENTASMSRVKEILHNLYVEMMARPEVKGTLVYYDVDPI